jgi:hypothetical protein
MDSALARASSTARDQAPALLPYPRNFPSSFSWLHSFNAHANIICTAIVTETSTALIAGMMLDCYPFDAAQREIAKITRFFNVPCIMPVRPKYPLIVHFSL